VHSLVERLVADGWRMTAQRRVIVDVLDRAIAEHEHPTADQVHERAAAVLPETSRATVYNTLGELVERGRLVPVVFDDRITRYDAAADDDGHHHHLVCTSCGAIQDVPAGAVSLPAPHVEGFEFASVDVVFRGRCASCTAAARSADLEP
jgi:Fur family transcriptional regulator, stress-responsive regulator